MGFKYCGDKQIIPPFYYNSPLLWCKSKFFPWKNQEKLSFSNEFNIKKPARISFTALEWFASILCGLPLSWKIPSLILSKKH